MPSPRKQSCSRGKIRASVLSEVGFEAEPFGKGTIAIKAVPARLQQADPAQLLRRLLDEWAGDGDAPTEAERVVRALAQIACHSVVRAGDRLTSSEAESLLRSLDTVDLKAQTPHGRATLLRLPMAEIGRRFAAELSVSRRLFPGCETGVARARCH